MKLNRKMLWATLATATAAVMMVGSVTVVGINRSSDDNVPPDGAEMTDAVDAVDGDATETAANANGTEEYRGGTSHGGGSRGGGSHSGASHGGGAHGGTHGGGHGFSHGGWSRGGNGWGRGGNWGRWGGSRWGRWGGGRYVGGRWVGGPYYGWCDNTYYACNRYWY